MGIIIGVVVYILLAGMIFESGTPILAIIMVVGPVAILLYAKKEEKRIHKETEQKQIHEEVNQKADAIRPVLICYHEMENNPKINKAASYVLASINENLSSLVSIEGTAYKIVLHCQGDSLSIQKGKNIDIRFSQFDLNFSSNEMIAFLYLLLSRCHILTYRCDVDGVQQESRSLMDVFFSTSEARWLYVKKTEAN